MNDLTRGPSSLGNKEYGKYAIFFICIFGIMPFVYAGNLLDPVEIPSLIAGLLIVSVFTILLHNRNTYSLTVVDLLWIIYVVAYIQSISVCKDSANVLFETIKCISTYFLFITFRTTVNNVRAV